MLEEFKGVVSVTINYVNADSRINVMREGILTD
jgi:hypothetical protein